MQEDCTYIPTTCIVLLVVVYKHAKMASVQNDGLTLPKIHMSGNSKQFGLTLPKDFSYHQLQYKQFQCFIHESFVGIFEYVTISQKNSCFRVQYYLSRLQQMQLSVSVSFFSTPVNKKHDRFKFSDHMQQHKNTRSQYKLLRSGTSD